MRTYSFPISFNTLAFRTFLICSIAFLGYHAIDTGLHGLQYFTNYPAEGGRAPALLLTHIGTGFVALMLGPWQFWPLLRQNYPNLHRWMGRSYLAAVAVSSLAGLYMAVTNPHLVFSTGTIGLALAWIITGTFAYLSVIRGFIKEHSQWMICNYVVTFAFVTYRIGRNFMLSEGFTPADTTIMAWLCWVPQLSVTVLLLQLSRSGIFKKDPFKKRPLANASGAFSSVFFPQNKGGTK